MPPTAASAIMEALQRNVNKSNRHCCPAARRMSVLFCVRERQRDKNYRLQMHSYSCAECTPVSVGQRAPLQSVQSTAGGGPQTILRPFWKPMVRAVNWPLVG